MQADKASREMLKILAPKEHMRVAINLGNAILAQKDPRSGAPQGVSVQLAKNLADRLSVKLNFITFDAQQKELPMFQAVLDNIGKPIVFNICMLGAVCA